MGNGISRFKILDMQTSTYVGFGVGSYLIIKNVK